MLMPGRAECREQQKKDNISQNSPLLSQCGSITGVVRLSDCGKVQDQWYSMWGIRSWKQKRSIKTKQNEDNQVSHLP